MDAVSIGANATGDESAVTGVDSLLYSVEWTGTSPVGELFIEFLKAPKEKTASGLDDWEAVDFGSQILISGNSGNHTINFTELPFTRVRPRYVRTSGVGSITITVLGKEG